MANQNTLTRWVMTVGAALLLLTSACSSAGATGETEDEATIATSAPTSAVTATSTAAPTSVAAPEANAAIQLATDYLAAVWALDADRVIAYMAPDAVTFYADTPDGVRLALRQIGAWQAKNTATGPCAVVESSPAGVAVQCPYEYHMLGSDQLGLGPYDGASIITVKDGKVVSEESSTDNDDALFSNEVWEPFEAWARATHPEDAELLFGDEWYHTEESFHAWEQRIAEYVESRLSG